MTSQSFLSRLPDTTTLFGVALAATLCVNRSHAQSGDERLDVPIDRAMRIALIEKLATQVESSYVFPDVGKNIATGLRDRLRSGAYDQITTAKSLTQTLTAELRKTGNDQHFRLEYFVIPRPMVKAKTGEQSEQQQAERSRSHCLRRSRHRNAVGKRIRPAEQAAPGPASVSVLNVWDQDIVARTSGQ